MTEGESLLGGGGLVKQWKIWGGVCLEGMKYAVGIWKVMYKFH